MNRRRLAKILYTISGWLTKIKTPQRVYKITFNDASSGFTKTRVERRRWMPWPFAMKVLGWSMKLDWDHFDHWACVHEHCNPSPCAECGGLTCQWDDEEEIEE